MLSPQRQLVLLLCLALAVSLVFSSPIPIVVLTVAMFITALFHVLWNDTIPSIFGLRRITFWESFRLLLLAWLLFGGVWVRYKP